jgi:hypothetical protein
MNVKFAAFAAVVLALVYVATAQADEETGASG